MGKIITIIALILVIGGIVIFSSGDNQEGAPSGGDQEMNSSEDSFVGSVKDLISRGESLTCDFSKEDENGKIEGTVYVADQKFRGDFSLTDSSGNDFQTSVVNDTEYAYTWGNSPFGDIAIKFAVEEPGSFADTDVTDNNQILNPNEDFEYKCQLWDTNPDVFTPPSDIEFLDFSQQLEQTFNDQCSACEQIPDETAQTECLKAFSCI